MTSGWYVLRERSGRLTVLWLYAGHPLAVAGPFEDYTEAVRRKEEMQRG